MIANAVEAFNSVADYGEVTLAGDWHGQTGWARFAIDLISESTLSPVIMQMGDFGFWPGNSGKKFIHRVNKSLAEHEKYAFITAGNHEDYRQIKQFRSVPRMEGCVYHPDYPRIVVLKRGYRWSWNDLNLISVGGANSIDRFLRVPGTGWWEGEQISDDDVRYATEGGSADIMFSHDAPMGIEIVGSHRDGAGWDAESIEYSNRSRHQLRRITDVVQPRRLFHGHYHLPVVTTTTLDGAHGEYVTDSRGMDRDYSGQNIGVLNLDAESFEGIRTPKPSWKFKSEEKWWLDSNKDKHAEWWN